MHTIHKLPYRIGPMIINIVSSDGWKIDYRSDEGCITPNGIQGKTLEEATQRMIKFLEGSDTFDMYMKKGEVHMERKDGKPLPLTFRIG